ncbi:SpoIIE family protein phosphatase [Streptomyces lienomycini]|uniref:SpoIIE family protein phosphatase n=1 Tax=Streptomyces lienomycini TaxID=284035 RepID=UPI0036360375
MPPALIVMTMVLDQVTPPRYFFGSLLTASVVLALFTYPPLGVLAVGAAGCVLLSVTEVLEDYVGPLTVVTLTVLATVTLLSTSLCVVRRRAESRFRRVQAVAEAVQLALLRPLPARVGPLRLAGFYRAADDEALIGGDLYSVRPTPFGIRAIVGDVKGKGISATQTVATVISSFQEAALLHPSLSQVAERIDVALQLDRDNPPMEPMGGGRPTRPDGHRGRRTRSSPRRSCSSSPRTRVPYGSSTGAISLCSPSGTARRPSWRPSTACRWAWATC